MRKACVEFANCVDMYAWWSPTILGSVPLYHHLNLKASCYWYFCICNMALSILTSHVVPFLEWAAAVGFDRIHPPSPFWQPANYNPRPPPSCHAFPWPRLHQGAPQTPLYQDTLLPWPTEPLQGFTSAFHHTCTYTLVAVHYAVNIIPALLPIDTYLVPKHILIPRPLPDFISQL